MTDMSQLLMKIHDSSMSVTISKAFAGKSLEGLHVSLKLSLTRMWADAQRDGRPAEYRWRHLQNFRNSIPCTMLQTFHDAHCSSAVQVTLPIKENPRVGRKVNFAHGKILLRGKSPIKCTYSVPAQETAKHRAKFGWLPWATLLH